MEEDELDELPEPDPDEPESELELEDPDPDELDSFFLVSFSEDEDASPLEEELSEPFFFLP